MQIYRKCESYSHTSFGINPWAPTTYSFKKWLVTFVNAESGRLKPLISLKEKLASVFSESGGGFVGGVL